MIAAIQEVCVLLMLGFAVVALFVGLAWMEGKE